MKDLNISAPKMSPTQQRWSEAYLAAMGSIETYLSEKNGRTPRPPQLDRRSTQSG